jgi:hypothetical protein
MSNMPIIVPCILLLRELLLNYVWDTFLNLLWSFLSEKQEKRMDKNKSIKLRGSFKGSNRYIKKYKNNWRRAKPSTKRGMISIELIINFNSVIKYGYISIRTKLRVKVRSSNQYGMVHSRSWRRLVLMSFV